MKTKKALSGNGAATRRRNVTPKAEKPKAKAKAKRTRKPKGLTPDELKEMAEINARLQADSKGMRLFNAIPKETESGAIHAETRKAFMAWKENCPATDLTGDQHTNQATKLVKQLRLYRSKLTVDVVSAQQGKVSKGELSQEIVLGFSGNVDNPDGIALTQKVITRKTGFSKDDLFKRMKKETVGTDKYVL